MGSGDITMRQTDFQGLRKSIVHLFFYQECFSETGQKNPLSTFFSSKSPWGGPDQKVLCPAPFYRSGPGGPTFSFKSFKKKFEENSVHLVHCDKGLPDKGLFGFVHPNNLAQW